MFLLRLDGIIVKWVADKKINNLHLIDRRLTCTRDEEPPSKPDITPRN